MLTARKMIKKIYADYCSEKSIPEEQKNPLLKLEQQKSNSETRKKIRDIQNKVNNK